MHSQITCINIHKFLIGLAALTATVSLPETLTAAILTKSEVTTYHFGIETALPDVGGRTVVDAQHADVGIPFIGGSWDLHVHGEEVGELAPEDALLYGNADTHLVMPNLPQYAFTGAAEGDDLWVLPQVQNSNVIFLGYGAEEMDAGDIVSMSDWNPGDPRGANVSGKWIKIELIAVRGPGDFSMWSSDSFGNPIVFFSTADGGITAGDVVYVPAGGHSHFNWGFTAVGEYEVDIRASTYIVPEPSTGALFAMGLLLIRPRKIRRSIRG